MKRDFRSLLHDAVGDLREPDLGSDRVWRLGQRRRRVMRIVSGSSLVAFGIVVALSLQAILGAAKSPDRVQPQVTDTPRPTCPQETLPNGSRQFAPRTYLDGEKRVMELAFLDGSMVEMVYPPDLALEQEFTDPQGHVRLERKGEEVVSGQTIVSFTGGTPPATPTETRPDGRGGTLRVWRPDVLADSESSLMLRFGCWVIDLRGLSASEQDLQTFIDNLNGIETSSGFLMLDPRPPVVVPSAEGFYPGGPSINIGDNITLIPGCGELQGLRQYEDNGLTIHVYEDGIRYWCDASGTISVYVRDVQLASRLIREVTFRDVKLVRLSR
jgi:hypothetical protein